MMKKVTLPVALAALVALGACAHGHHGGGHRRHTPTVGERIPILASETDISADKTIADVQVTVPEAAPNDSWAQPSGNAEHAMGHLALGAEPSRVWSARINAGDKRQRLAAAPVVADGKLFVVDVDANVRAYNADRGGLLWSHPIATDKANQSAWFGGGVSYDDGKLFATDGLGDVVALNAADGKEIWRAKPGGPLRGAPSIANGNVYALSQDNQLYALGEADGKVAWSQAGSIESQGVFGVAAPASAQGTIVAGFSSGELNAYRYENGRSLWQDVLSRTSMTTSVSSLADIDANPVIDNGRVYALGQGGRLVALEIVSGQRLWEQTLAGISTPWLAGEWLFVVTDDARLICVSAGSGKIRWISQLPNFHNLKKKKGHPITWTGPVLAGGRLIVLSSEGTIAYASPQTGAIQSQTRTKVPFTLPPVVANKTLYVLDSMGRLSAYR
jgi:outer membrane protein assembly factor BamB